MPQPTFPQAAIIFNIAKRMVEKNTRISGKAFGLEVWAKAITRYETGSSFKPITQGKHSQDGLNPVTYCTWMRSTHTKHLILLNVLNVGGRCAGQSSMVVHHHRRGTPSQGPWGELRGILQKSCLLGVFGNDADHFLALFWAVDEEGQGGRS